MTTELLLHFDGPSGSRVLTDASGNDHYFTCLQQSVPSPQLSSAQYVFGGSSLAAWESVFGLSYAAEQNSTVCNFGTGDFTFECWIQAQYIGDIFGVQTGNAFNIAIVTGGYLHVTSGFTAVVTGATPVYDSKWHSIAYSRKSGVGYLYVDGVLDHAAVTDTNNYSSSSAAVYIGHSFYGYIDELRVSNAGLYTAGSYTPAGPFQPFPTPAQNSAQLLMHFDGANGSTVFTDVFGHVFSQAGAGSPAPVISTAQYEFGGSSLLVATGGTWISTPASTDFDFGTGDFTVEFWIYPTQPDFIMGSYGSGTSWGLQVSGSAPNYSLTLLESGSSSYATTGSILPDSTWSAVAWTRSNGTTRIFINGVLKYTYGSADTYNFYTGANPFTVGGGHSFFSGFQGYIDELRITRGAALYTAGYTPATSEFTNTPVGSSTNSRAPTMASLSNYFVNNVIDQVLRGQTPLQPANVYVALLVAANGVQATSTTYGAAAYVTALALDGQYHLYYTVAGGTTAASGTIFNGIPGETVADGTVTWVEQTAGLKANTAGPINEPTIGVGGYVRAAIASSLVNWAGTQGPTTTSASTGTSGETSNNGIISYAAPTSNWAAAPAVVWGLALYDGSTLGANLLLVGPMTTPQSIASGSVAPIIPQSDLTFTFS